MIVIPKENRNLKRVENAWRSLAYEILKRCALSNYTEIFNTDWGEDLLELCQKEEKDFDKQKIIGGIKAELKQLCAMKRYYETLGDFSKVEKIKLQIKDKRLEFNSYFDENFRKFGKKNKKK